MLDLRFIRQNPEIVKKAVRVKGIQLDVDELLRLDSLSRDLRGQVDEAQRMRRDVALQFRAADDATRATLRAESDRIAVTGRALREDLASIDDQLHEMLLRTPTIPWEGAPIGSDESANVIIKRWGEPPQFDFQLLDHVELVEKRGWVEFAGARTVAGERAYALVGDMVLLERGLHSFALDVLTQKGFTIISVPSLVKESALVGSGFLPGGRAEIYKLPEDDLFLAGTAEVALCGLHSEQILTTGMLPLRYAGISPCFRREIGSASRDVRGLLRVHQFEKVEQFILCRADSEESARWHATLLATAEEILQTLGICYQVVECCTGDMGVGKYRMNDINSWFPSLGLFRETHSCSSLHDWQARRANLRYRDEDGKVRFVHTLNNTAVATPRLLACLIENFQTSSHCVRVPEVLRPYMHGRDLI